MKHLYLQSLRLITLLFNIVFLDISLDGCMYGYCACDCMAAKSGPQLESETSV